MSKVKDEKAREYYLESVAEQADKILKSIYSLEMLGIGKPVLEAELEKRIVERIKHVLLELGSGFSFIGNQYRVVSPSGTENFIDLLFFHHRNTGKRLQFN